MWYGLQAKNRKKQKMEKIGKVEVIVECEKEVKEDQGRDMKISLPLNFIEKFDDFGGNDKKKVDYMPLNQHWGQKDNKNEGYRYTREVVYTMKQEAEYLTKVVSEVETAREWYNRKIVRVAYKTCFVV